MNEIYLYKKNPKNKTTINVGMAYPSTYYYGMSVLGYLSMFKEFDQNPRVYAQRIFLNTSTLAFRPKYYDLIGFSCVFELDILQILKILKKYNFQMESNKRNKNTPLIFAGGPVITSNPEPFADFFDFMIIGDGEGIANEITKVYLKNRAKSKQEILSALAMIEGIYVPSLYKIKYDKERTQAVIPLSENAPRIIQKRYSKQNKCLYSPIISEDTFYSNTVFIELERGCPFECKFCTAHWQNLPLRCFDVKYIRKIIKIATKFAKKIVFIGAMVSAHPQFDEICKYLNKLKEKKNFQVEFSSMSFDFPSKYVADIIDDKTISLSVEAGSQELRFKTGKNLSDDKIYEIIDFYSKRGVTKFNLYYMIGLPDETDDDIDKYLDFSIKLAQNYKDVKFCHIISTFNPKPATPFERKKKQCTSILKEKLSKIESTLNENDIETIMPIPSKDAINSLISLSDRRLGKYIRYVFEKNIPIKNFFKEYKIFMKKQNPKLSDNERLPHYSKYIYRTKIPDELLPWEFIKYKCSE